MKSMPGHIRRKMLETATFDPFSSLGVEKTKKNQGLLLFSFGSDIPAGFYSLVLCDLSWDAIAPYTHAIVVHEGLHGRASQDFSMMVTVAPCTKRNDKKSHEEKMVWILQGNFLSQQLSD